MALAGTSCAAIALAYFTTARTKAFGIDLYDSDQSIGSD